MDIIRLENITKLFAGNAALDNVNLSVSAGEVHAICGENGAGKSTLMKIISGVIKQTSGKYFINDELVDFSSTKDANKFGINMVYQEFNLINDLSVAENMYLGRLPKKNGFVDFKALYKNAQNVLDDLGLNLDSKSLISELSVAKMQMVEIAKCLTYKSKLIIFDEPTAALTDKEIQVLFEIIAKLKESGISILYISHRMDEVFKISDRITVLRDGKYIKTLLTSQTSYDEIVSLMVGKTIDKLYVDRNHINNKAVLEVNNLFGKSVKDVSFKLYEGEILGIAGLIGSGNIELSKLIYGAYRIKGGEMIYKGEKIYNRSPKESLKNKIALVSDDRKNEGLVLIRSVKDNIILSSLSKFVKGVFINKSLENGAVESEVKRLNIKIADKNQSVYSLSGGNQQKVVFAKVLETEPDILILCEPTRGIDVGAREEIYKIIDDLTKEGKSIILVSTDLNEVIGLSDRVLVMREGKIVFEVDKKELNQENILAYASGGVDEK